MKYRLFLNERLRGFRRWIDSRDSRRFGLVMLAILAVGLTVLIGSNYLPSRYDFEVGDVATETVVAPRTVTFENRSATEELQEQAADLVEPVYQPNPTALATVTSNIHSLFEEARRLGARVRGEGVEADPGGVEGAGGPTVEGTSVETTAPQAEGEAEGDQPATTATTATQTTTTATTDVVPAVPPLSSQEAFTTLRSMVGDDISDDTLRFLLGADPEELDSLEQEIRGMLRIVYAERVTEASLESNRSVLRSMADSLVMESSSTQDAAYGITSAYLRPNYVLDSEETQLRRQEAAGEVAPVMVTVLKGERVVQTGDIITQEDLLALQNLGLVETRASWNVWVGVFLIVLFELLILSLMLYRFGQATLQSNNLLLVIATLVLLFGGISRLLAVPPLSPYLIPVAALGMLATIILDARTGFVLVVMQSLNIGLMTNLDFGFTLVAFLVGSLSLYLVSHLAQRSELLSAGGILMLAGGAAVFAMEVLRESAVLGALESSLWGVGSGFLSLILAVSLLTVFEPAFNLTTPLRLLELANPSQRLLRRLMQVAPGTYNHSILMGNIAEAAAEAVGADPLLARVGAYYHDIGKTQRPEYFIENQLHMKNPHDKMNPNLSKLAVKAHVRDGVDLAVHNGLPRPIIDIIRQHHGTSVLSYFYHKAKESSSEVVSEETYRYAEEKPTSPEAAIIMLADSVEAAVKSIPNPTVKKVQTTIREIFKQKMEDGQLSRSQLTFGDLEKIREVFENGMRGFVGHRIEYPHDQRVDEERVRATAGGWSKAGPEHTRQLRPVPPRSADNETGREEGSEPRSEEEPPAGPQA